MASTTPSDGTILDRLLPELREVLNISDIRPHLKCAHLLTDDEYEQLDIGPNNPTGEAISKLVTILKRKGPHCATMLLGALQQSVSGQSKHYGHFQVIERLKRELRAAGRMDESNRQNGKNPLLHSYKWVPPVFQSLETMQVMKPCEYITLRMY